jgi:hypothetical protein
MKKLMDLLSIRPVESKRVLAQKCQDTQDSHHRIAFLAAHKVAIIPDLTIKDATTTRGMIATNIHRQLSK